MACYNEVETNIKHPKAKDTSEKREGKREKEREVLGWFRHKAMRNQQTARAMRCIALEGEKPKGSNKERKDNDEKTLSTAPSTAN